MLGCCGQIARRWHCLGAQVFVFLAKDKGDSLRVTTLADEKKVRSFTACDDVYAWWPDSGSGAEIQWTTLSQLVWQDTDLTRPKCCILDRFWTFSTSRWESIVDTTDLSQSTCCRLGHHQCSKASSQGEYSESSTHVQAVLPTVGLAESACGYDCEQLLLALDHSEELFPKFRTPTSLMVQVKNKTQKWAILWHWLFGIKACDWARPHSAGSGADDYVWRK